MNEEELRSIWTADQTVPTIDFEVLQKALNSWQDKLRRKIRIDIWTQSITAVATLIPIFFFPKLIFASVMVFILGIWYVRELRRLSIPEETKAGYTAVKDSLNAKIATMKSYFRRTRFVIYVLCLPIVPAAFYGVGMFDPSAPVASWAFWLFIILIIYEIGVIIGTELYFKIIYTPALNELKSLRGQLELNE